MQIQPNPQKEFLYLGIFAKNQFYKEIVVTFGKDEELI